ncbi:DUF1349 domain-containing protein [Nonomuraea typhae]|uniref:DUF1349 domain-containing protein n=1 Tax=Nonomuraea typhae TaxID=2603600 RepID=UPI0012F8C17F|nr:DUF1349 domain-containing protein [Nonomuraea typhae]
MIMAFGATGWQWLNPPREWTADDGLSLFCDGGTDLWRRTGDGFTVDNAHLFVRPGGGDLRLSVTFTAEYGELYDQAGAVLRIDDTHWVKAGVEFMDGTFSLVTVVTRDYSDASLLPLHDSPDGMTFRLDREGDTVSVRYGLAGEEPDHLLRRAYFPPSTAVLAGAMAAAPVSKGFPVRFTDVRVLAG